MARPLRIEYPGAVYHITSRGNERRAIFKDDEDHQNFLNIILKVNQRYNWICHAYCLMENHYHLLIETPDGNISLGMRQLNGVYTQMLNRRYGRSGHLFQGRFKGILIQKESHLLEVCRYIVLNPVRARSVEKPSQWKWSSYLATAGIKQPHDCLTIKWILMQFNSQLDLACQAYRRFVKEGIHQESIWCGLKAQILLGEGEFAESLIDYAKGHKNMLDIPKSQRFIGRPELKNIFAGDTICEKGIRNDKIVKAVEQYGYRQSEVADYLGMHFTSISRIMRERESLLNK